jgi:hypothetical protein
VRKAILVFGLVAALITAGVETRAIGDDEDSRATLRGLPGVGVFVTIGNTSPEVAKFGLTETRVRTETELHLRRAGIKILTHEQAEKVPGKPHLAVDVNAIKTEAGLYAFDLDVQLRQDVALQRRPTIKLTAPTWSVSGVATVGESRLRGFVNEAVGDLVDQFCNAYLAMNPKE